MTPENSSSLYQMNKNFPSQNNNNNKTKNAYQKNENNKCFILKMLG